MSLIEMSILGGILIIGIIILRALLMHRLSKQMWVTLWMIAIIRLLIPVQLPLDVPGIGSLTNHVNIEWSNLPSAVQETTDLLEAKNADSSITEQSRMNHGNILWILGAFVIACYMISSYVRDKKLLKEAIPETRIAECYKEMGSDKILISDRIRTPITYGIFKPVIILPKEIELQNKELLLYVLHHERIHIKYHDNLFKLLLLITVCVHWYNPLVWVMWILCQRDLELRCDEQVIRAIGAGNKKEYALALLSMAEQSSNGFVLGVGFGKKAIRERMEAIMKYKKATIIGSLMAVIVITATLTAFITVDVQGSSDQSKEYAVEVSETKGDDKVHTVTALEEAKTIETESKVKEYSFELSETNGDDKVYSIKEETTLDESIKEDVQKYADRFSEYGVSVVIEDTDYQFYYKEEPVCFVADNKANDGSFSGTVYFNADHGKKGVVTIRNKKGEITGMKLLSEEETEEYNGRYW